MKIVNYNNRILGLKLRFIKLLRLKKKQINMIIILFNKNNIMNKNFIKTTRSRI